MSFHAKFDATDFLDGLDRLAAPLLRTKLGRSMGVAGGSVVRDEAKMLVRKDSGLLESAIYLAFQDDRSTATQIIYSVSWNHRKAPHGHFEEFGHWQPYQVVKLSSGEFITLKDKPLPEPKWMPAHPFLRPAGESAGVRAREAMIARGRQRLPELLAGVDDEP